ncbi:hypothetical protein LX16_4395 [Stackebrandtia albiflava]|uniref:Uncharacterized protein n=1 Tax=Stackebrandtia albiflava TaxID=406432 RepID=A0A562URE5_9ACTN|nr:hypothetical protein [Stackebrandtia albiflava]TWJ08174.1 hypothetical protein LX16_4395 [Stackebrandtia albiflava]
MRLFEKFGDKMLSKFVPERNASAGCPPDCIQERQMSGGYCRYRSCCYRSNCSYGCSAWSSWGSC